MAAPRPNMDQRQMVAALTREGLTLAEIAARLDMTTRAVSRHRAALHIAHTQRQFTADEHRRALELIADGCSLQEVALTLGRSYHTIMWRYKYQGWTKSQTAEFNGLRKLERQVFGE